MKRPKRETASAFSLCAQVEFIRLWFVLSAGNNRAAIPQAWLSLIDKVPDVIE